MLKFRTIIFSLIALCVLTQPLAEAKSTPTYLVAIETEDPIQVMIYDSFSKELGVNFEYIEFSNFSEAMSAVTSGYIDLFANVTYTEERNQILDFTPPTNLEYVYLYTLENITLDNVHTLGVPQGTVYHLSLSEEFPEIKFVEFKEQEDALDLLYSGAVDGFLDGLNHLKFMTLNGVNASLFNDHLTLQPVSIVAPKGKHQDLLSRIEQLAHTGRFQKLLRELVEHYQLQIRKQGLRKEVIKKGINTRSPLKVKLENIKLFVNYQPDGSVDGITADTLFELCNILQLDCQLVSDSTEPWASMYDSLLDQSIDILSPLAITDARKEQFYLSDSYYSPDAILVKRKHYKDDVYRSVSEMLVERIGVVEGNFFQSLLNNMLPGKTLYLYPSQHELLDALLNHKVDYIVLTRAAFHSKLREAKSILNIAEEDKVGSIYTYNLGFGFPKTEQGKALSELFSKALPLVDLNNIAKKYDYPPDWYTTINDQKKVSRNSISRFAFIISLLLLVLAIFYRRSITDELTRLRNRRAIYRKYGSSFPYYKTLVYLDVNKFKIINDTYGHRVGDIVLKRLSSNIIHYWQGDAYRIGGDEFVLVSRESREQIEQRLKNISAFNFVHSPSQGTLEVTTSVGIADNFKENLPLDEVLHIADKAMYKSKTRFRHSNKEKPLFER